MMERQIYVTFVKEGLHHYPTPPKEVGFLGYPHRHLFHFKVTITVFHDDRELEFILLKRELEKFVEENVLSGHVSVTKSCEMMAEEIIEHIGTKYGNRKITVEVSEDGENGAIVTYIPEQSCNQYLDQGT